MMIFCSRSSFEVKYQHPLKQGLKLKHSDYKTIEEIVKYQHPLKQGLKPNLIMIPQSGNSC